MIGSNVNSFYSYHFHSAEAKARHQQLMQYLVSCQYSEYIHCHDSFPRCHQFIQTNTRARTSGIAPFHANRNRAEHHNLPLNKHSFVSSPFYSMNPAISLTELNYQEEYNMWVLPIASRVDISTPNRPKVIQTEVRKSGICLRQFTANSTHFLPLDHGLSWNTRAYSSVDTPQQSTYSCAAQSCELSGWPSCWHRNTTQAIRP